MRGRCTQMSFDPGEEDSARCPLSLRTGKICEKFHVEQCFQWNNAKTGVCFDVSRPFKAGLVVKSISNIQCARLHHLSIFRSDNDKREMMDFHHEISNGVSKSAHMIFQCLYSVWPDLPECVGVICTVSLNNLMVLQMGNCNNLETFM